MATQNSLDGDIDFRDVNLCSLKPLLPQRHSPLPPEKITKRIKRSWEATLREQVEEMLANETEL